MKHIFSQTTIILGMDLFHPSSLPYAQRDNPLF